MAATATVKGGLFEAVGLNTLTQIGTGSSKRKITQAFNAKGVRALRMLAYQLNGAAAGATATATVSRVEANSELGGKRTIETETLVNRATTAGDVSDINEDLLKPMYYDTYDNTPPANKDGNPLGTR